MRSALLLVLFLAPLARAQPAPDEAEVAAAIGRGVEWLRSQQSRGGRWNYSFNADHATGMTALAGLALLENGAAADDRAIQRAEAFVLESAGSNDQTYDVALGILFLSRLDRSSPEPRHSATIRDLADRLAAGQQDGQWTYGIPRDLGSGREGSGRRGRLVFGEPDNSNTQFAFLGMWSAGRLGFDANQALADLDQHFRESANESGGWGYQPGRGSTPAMTCAGLMGLAIAAARPERAEELSARSRGKQLAADPIFQAALARVARDARQIDGSSDIYYIWSLERVCVALGLRDLDGLDWYAAGAAELLRRQERDGGWPDQQWGRLPSTALALLFLRKANLAFELDRVLKLPRPGDDRRLAVADAPEAPPPADNATTGDDRVQVVVRQVDESRFPEITLDFEVKDAAGQPMLDGQKADFRVTEYDAPVEVVGFVGPRSKEIRPTTVVLVVDRSGSMEEEDRIGAMKRSVASFLKVMPAGSRVAVVAFGDQVELVCPFTVDIREVQSAVDALEPEGGTRYYDAVEEAIRLIGPEAGRKAILALTDGEDTVSTDADLDSSVAAARRVGLPVHTLGLGTEDEIASDDLKRLAAETRGQYFAARDADQLGAIYEEIAQRLGQSYTLSYRTDRPLPDGTLRPVKIYYRAARAAAGEAELFVRGMVVPASGWSRLFLALLAGLIALAWLPGATARGRRGVES